MKRIRFEHVLVVVGAVIVMLLAFAGANEKQRARQVSVYSSYDTGPNGYRALYEALRGAGVPVSRFERVLGVLDPSVKTIVLTGYERDPSAKPMDEHDSAYLRRFVENGGRLVALDAEFAGSDDVAPGVGTSVAANGTGAIALARNAYTGGVTGVRGPIDWVFPFKDRRGVPLLANAHGMVAAAYRVGRGEVIAVTAPALFGNAQIRNEDNARFAYNAIAGHGPAVFDEYVHGYDDGRTLWAALPSTVRAAAWIVLVIVLLALVGANVRFAPPYLPTPPDERDSSDYISAMAELMRRTRRRASDDDVLWQATIDFHRRKEHA